MFILASLFIVARTWQQLKCLSTEERVKTMWYIFTMGGYSATKQNEIGSFVATGVDGPRDCYTEWSKSGREKQILYMNAYLWGWGRWYRSYLQSWNKTHRGKEQTFGHRDGEGRWNELGDWGWHIYTTDTLYKIDGLPWWFRWLKKKNPACNAGDPASITNGKLLCSLGSSIYLVLCGDLNRKEIH